MQPVLQHHMRNLGKIPKSQVGHKLHCPKQNSMQNSPPWLEHNQFWGQPSAV